MLRFGGLKSVLTGFVLLGAVASAGVMARSPVWGETAVMISVAELPRQGLQTYQLIHQGGPFAREKDGVVFGLSLIHISEPTRPY